LLPAGAAWALRALAAGPSSGASSGKGGGLFLAPGDAAPQLLALLLAWNLLGALLAAWALGPSAVGAAALGAAREQWRQARDALAGWADGSRGSSQRARLALQALWRAHPRGLVVAALALGAALAVSLRRWLLSRRERRAGACPDSVTEDDLAAFLAAVDGSDEAREGPWEAPFFDRDTSSSGRTVASMRDRQSTRGPTQLRALSTYELTPPGEAGEGEALGAGLSPEGLRDFFYDDAFRSQWDKCITQARSLGRSPDGGSEFVYFVRKFPSFCADKDYVIARRTWEGPAGEFFCVTKAARHSRAPDTTGQLKRVTEFRSCWRIRAVPSSRVPGAAAVELLLVHEEGLHIPNRLARFAVRHLFGWFQRDVEPGIRAWNRRFGGTVHAGAPAGAPGGTGAGGAPGRAAVAAKARLWLKMAAMAGAAAYLGGATTPVGLCGLLATGAARRWASPAPARR